MIVIPNRKIMINSRNLQNRNKSRRKHGNEITRQIEGCKMTTLETFTSFFACEGLLDIGTAIAKHLSARDLVALMQVRNEFQDFVLENSGIRLMFIKKAQVECPFEEVDYHSITDSTEFNIILANCNSCLTRNEILMKMAVMRFKLELQFLHLSGSKWANQSRAPSSLFVAYHLDQPTMDEFIKEFKNFMRYCKDSHRKSLLFGLKWQQRSMHELLWIIFQSLENKTQILDDDANTALHYLADASNSFGRKPSPNIRRHLEEWLQSLPPGQLRCPTNKSGRTPLHFACKADGNFDVEIIKILCKYMTPDQIGLADWAGRTALREVCGMGYNNFEIIKILCQNMTSEQFGLADPWGRTALHAACLSFNAHVDVIKVICQKMTQDQFGLRTAESDYYNTALHSACYHSKCDVEIVKVLCHYMSEDQIAMKNRLHYQFPIAKKTALEVARGNTSKGAPAIVKFLSDLCPS